MHVAISRVNALANCFANRVINVWNSLPEDIVSASTLGAFRGHLSNLDLSVYCAGRFD